MLPLLRVQAVLRVPTDDDADVVDRDSSATCSDAARCPQEGR